jgi:hypothetical protein
MSLTTTLTILKNNPLKFPHWIVIVLMVFNNKRARKRDKERKNLYKVNTYDIWHPKFPNLSIINGS